MSRSLWLFIGLLALSILLTWLETELRSRRRRLRKRMQRFGGPWGALECEEVPTPVGELCLRCKVPIKRGDQGVVLPLMHVLGTWVPVPEHRDCVLETILGPQWRRILGRDQ